MSSSLHQHDERLPFFDDIRGELRPGNAANVPRRVNGSSRNEHDISGFQRHWQVVVDLILQRSLDHVDDLFARMPMLAERRSRSELDAHLDDFASGRAEIVSLKIRA